MSTRAAPWLAWSLMVLSVVLLVGGIALALMTRSSAPQRPYDGPVDAVFSLATVLTFSVVGAIIASRQPRNAIGWIFCGVGLVMGINSLAGGYAEYRLSGGYGTVEPRRDGGMVRLVVVDPPGIRTHELPALVVPRRPAALAALAARGLVRCARAHRLRRGHRAEAGTTRRLPTDHEPLRCRQPYSGCGCGHR